MLLSFYDIIPPNHYRLWQAGLRSDAMPAGASSSLVKIKNPAIFIAVRISSSCGYYTRNMATPTSKFSPQPQSCSIKVRQKYSLGYSLLFYSVIPAAFSPRESGEGIQALDPPVSSTGQAWSSLPAIATLRR
ncbi:hypothetical protein KJ590_01850 [Patescibacteria group bacterium]|nr:hypothetical protein [Patescibacteria group bacterium]MBU4142725.1 hypothetical protein [Patescibacteria group bacterium]